MCGITGIIHFNVQPIARKVIENFTHAIEHRGPDGQGIWIDDEHHIAFGHRRLAILDLSETGNQPMHFGNGRYTIVFNGEIFNFLEIRQDLEKLGYTFYSQSDTEVILAAYHEWRAKMLPKFNGMWALAIYDKEDRSLFIARDRYGIKPFIYMHDHHQFGFASELKAFKQLEGFHPQLDEETAHFFLQNPQAVEVTTRTIFKNCRKLPAGHWGILKNGKLHLSRWWNTIDNLPSVPQRFDEQVEQFRSLFDDAVQLRMRSDVPVGSCLSGGFDSTSVVCTLAHLGKDVNHPQRQAADWQHTFVASFPGSTLDERPLAEQTIQMAGVQGHFINIHNSDALPDIDQVLTSFDDVGLVLPTSVWQIYRELRRHKIVVSLDGHGADELMGGYKDARYLTFVDAPSWLQAPLVNMSRLRNYHSQTNTSSSSFNVLRDAFDLSALSHPDFAWYRSLKLSTKQIFTRLTRSNPFGFLRMKKLEFNEDFTPFTVHDQLPDEWGAINRELYDMFHTSLLPTILRNFDRLSMAHGIEVRMPFMDWRLVSFVMNLPAESKIGFGVTKRIAREAMRNRIPEDIRVSKVKIGFNSPTHEWFNSSMQGWVERYAKQLEHSSLQEIVDTKKLLHYVQQHNRNHSWQWNSAMNVWKYVHLGWFQNHFL